MLKIKKEIVRRLKWGVAGCGNFAENAFMPAIHLLPKSKLVSLYSSDINRARFLKDQFAAQGAYNNYDEFLDSGIDCVYIASANANHFDQVVKAAQHGKHIHCEKPLAVTTSEAEEMVRVCEENNVLLSVNYVYRFHPLVTKAKEIIDKGMLGKLVTINANFNVDYAPNDNFRFKKELSGGGALRDIGTHMIDLLRFFGGEITSICGSVDNIIYKSDVDDFAAAIVRFENGGYGYFNSSFNVKKGINRLEILGYNGNIVIENLIGKRSAPTKLIIDLHGEGRKAFRKRANKMVHTLREVQKSFLTNTLPAVTGYDGLINLRLMEQLEQECL